MPRRVACLRIPTGLRCGRSKEDRLHRRSRVGVPPGRLAAGGLPDRARRPAPSSTRHYQTRPRAPPVREVSTPPPCTKVEVALLCCACRESRGLDVRAAVGLVVTGHLEQVGARPSAMAAATARLSRTTVCPRPQGAGCTTRGSLPSRSPPVSVLRHGRRRLTPGAGTGPGGLGAVRRKRARH